MKRFLSKILISAFLALVMLMVTTLALPCVQTQAATAPESWAVIVGIEKFENITQDSLYAVNDGRELSDKLSPVWGSSHVRLLTNSQATKDNILSDIDWLVDNASFDDTVLFYYSGYGVWNLAATAVDSIAPYDFRSDRESSVILCSELATALNRVEAAKSVIIMEVSSAGSFQSRLSDNGRIVLMASGVGQYTSNPEKLENSAFTYFLLQALDKFDVTDTNHDYELSVEEIFQYANLNTTQFDEAEGYYYKQYPVIDDRYSGEMGLVDEFVFGVNTNLPSGQTILTLDGKNYTSVPAPIFWASGSTHTITVPQTLDMGYSTRLVFAKWDDGDTSATRTITKGSYVADYNIEKQLSITSDYGTITGAGWYPNGTTATFSITPSILSTDTNRYFNGWSGDYSANQSSGTLTMNTPKTLSANWRTEYLVTINSLYGQPTGAGWYKQGTPATININALVETPDTKHYFTGWSGDFTGMSAGLSLTINGPATLTASWRNEYYVKISSEYGQPSGVGWYKEGERANIYVEPTQGFLIRHIFTGWSGDISDIQANAVVNMDSGKVITANWRTDYVQLILLIVVVIILAGGITATIILVSRRRRSNKPVV